LYICFIFKLKVKLLKNEWSRSNYTKNEKLQFVIFIIYFQDYDLYFDKMNYYFCLFVIGSHKVNLTEVIIVVNFHLENEDNKL